MKTYTEQLREELWCDVMEDYVITAELGHLAKDEKLHKQEMRQHFDRLVEWITSKHTNYLSELREKIKKLEQPKHEHGKDCKNYDDCRMFTRHERSYNQALADTLTLLDNDIQQLLTPMNRYI